MPGLIVSSLPCSVNVSGIPVLFLRGGQGGEEDGLGGGWGEVGRRQKLGRVDRGEAVVRVYYMRKE